MGVNPEPEQLVVYRHDPPGPPSLREELIKAVEEADVEHARPGEVLGKRGDAVAMVARGAGRIDALSAVQRECVKPERHSLDSGARERPRRLRSPAGQPPAVQPP